MPEPGMGGTNGDPAVGAGNTGGGIAEGGEEAAARVLNLASRSCIMPQSSVWKLQSMLSLSVIDVLAKVIVVSGGLGEALTKCLSGAQRVWRGHAQAGMCLERLINNDKNM